MNILLGNGQIEGGMPAGHQPTSSMSKVVHNISQYLPNFGQLPGVQSIRNKLPNRRPANILPPGYGGGLSSIYSQPVFTFNPSHHQPLPPTVWPIHNNPNYNQFNSNYNHFNPHLNLQEIAKGDKVLTATDNVTDRESLEDSVSSTMMTTTSTEIILSSKKQVTASSTLSNATRTKLTRIDHKDFEGDSTDQMAAIANAASTTSSGQTINDDMVFGRINYTWLVPADGNLSPNPLLYGIRSQLISLVLVGCMLFVAVALVVGVLYRKRLCALGKTFKKKSKEELAKKSQSQSTASSNNSNLTDDSRNSMVLQHWHGPIAYSNRYVPWERDQQMPIQQPTLHHLPTHSYHQQQNMVNIQTEIMFSP